MRLELRDHGRISRGILPVLGRLVMPGAKLVAVVGYVDMPGVVRLMESLPLEAAYIFYSRVIPTDPETYQRLIEKPLWDRVKMFELPDPKFHLKLYLIVNPDGRAIALETSANLTEEGLVGNLEHVRVIHGGSRYLSDFLHMLKGRVRRTFPFVPRVSPLPGPLMEPEEFEAWLRGMLWEDTRLSYDPEVFARGDLKKIEGQILDGIRIVGGYLAGEKGRFLISEPGTGKTIITGMALRYLWNAGLANRILIVTKKSIIPQWIDELTEKFGLTPERLERSSLLDIMHKDRVIAISTYEFVRSRSEKIFSRYWDVAVFDESDYRLARYIQTRHRISQGGETMRYTLLLTATPVRRDIEEFFTQLRFVTSDEEVDVLKRLFENGTVSPMIYLTVTRRTLEDMLGDGGVDSEYIPLTISLKPEEWEIYHSLDGVMRNRFLSHPYLLTKMVPEYQVKADEKTEKRIYRAVPVAESFSPVARLIEILNRHEGEQAVVFVRYRGTGKIIAETLRQKGHRAELFHGELDDQERWELARRFKDGEIDVLVITRQVMEGLNLQNASVLINYDVPPNYGELVQRIGRICRIGQERKVYIYTLIVEGTPAEERYKRIMELKQQLKRLIPEGVLDQIVVMLSEEEGEDYEPSEAEMKSAAELTSKVYQMAEITTAIEEYRPQSPNLHTSGTEPKHEGREKIVLRVPGLSRTLWLCRYTARLGGHFLTGTVLWDGTEVVDEIPKPIGQVRYSAMEEESHIPGAEILAQVIAYKHSAPLKAMESHVQSIIDHMNTIILDPGLRTDASLAMIEHIPEILQPEVELSPIAILKPEKPQEVQI